MDKKTQYIVGGIAVIGIIAYLYNQKKKSDALKSALVASPPDSSVGNDLVVPNFGDTNPVAVENMVINPDGSIIDASVISFATSPSTSNVTSSPSKDTTTTTSSAPARFDGGFANAIGAKGKKKSAKFDGGFEYATGSNCDPILGL